MFFVLAMGLSLSGIVCVAQIQEHYTIISENSPYLRKAVRNSSNILTNAEFMSYLTVHSIVSLPVIGRACHDTIYTRQLQRRKNLPTVSFIQPPTGSQCAHGTRAIPLG